MKTNRFVLSVMLILTSVLVRAQDYTLVIKAGVAPPLKSSGLKDFQISDGDPLGAAYLNVPLSTNKPDGTPIILGAELLNWFSPKVAAGFELDLAFKSKTIGGSAYGIVTYNLLGEMDDTFMLGATAKLGLSYYQFDLGGAVITGTPPFNNGKNSINNGDPLKGTITPGVYQLGATVRLKLGDELYLNIQPAMGGTFSSNSEIGFRCNGEGIQVLGGSEQYIKLGGLSLTAGIELTF